MARGKSNLTKAPAKIKWVYDQDKESEAFPWGPHRMPLSLEFEGVTLEVQKFENGFVYRREGLGESSEKVLLADNGNLSISPVEPLHIPPGLSTHLLVDFAQPVVIEPRAVKEVMVTFPLELACSIESPQGVERILDVFTLCRTKFTLYGSVRDGLICKYWKSDIYYSIPAVNPALNGIMKVAFHNPGNRWAEMNKAVFSAQGMKIYFNGNLVSMSATIKISSENTAETNFLDEALKAGMQKAPEQFSARLLSQSRRIVMEEGH
jgi:uncharacterized protein